MKYLVIALLVLACIAGCLGTTTGPPPADEIAARFIAAQEQVEDFSATVTVTAGSENVTLRLFQKGSDCYRLEYLEPAGLAGTVAVSNSTRKWRYDPAARTALTVAGPYMTAAFSEPPYPGWAEEVRGYAGTVAKSLSGHNTSCPGSEITGGRTAYILEVTDDRKLFEAPTRYREAVYRLNIWIDARTWLLLGVDMYGREGDLILSAEYSDPSANAGLPDALFAFDPPPGTAIRPMPTAAITPLFLQDIDDVRRCSVEMPSHLPPGYTFVDGVYLPGAYTVLRFTNGNDELKVMHQLYDPYQEADTFPGSSETVLLTGGREAEYISADGKDHLRWRDGEYSCLITGGMLGRDELMRVAASMAA